MTSRHQVVIVPRQPLAQGGSYDASVSTTYAGDMAPTVTAWSFTTAALPEVSIGNASIVEGQAKTRSVRATVSLSKPSPTPISVHYATVPGTATAPSDYSAKAGTVTIPASSTSAVISIPVKGDRLLEPNEAFAVQLTNPQGGAVLRRSTGSVQIRNDDKAGPISNAVRLSIGNASVMEGNRRPQRPVQRVPLHRRDGPGEGRLRHRTGNRRRVRLHRQVGDRHDPARDDVSGRVGLGEGRCRSPRANEQFSVKLSNPVGASIQFGTGSGSILNDDSL